MPVVEADQQRRYRPVGLASCYLSLLFKDLISELKLSMARV